MKTTSSVDSRTFKEYFLSLHGRDAGNEAIESLSHSLAITVGVNNDTNLASKVKVLADDVGATFFVGTTDQKVDAIHSVVDSEERSPTPCTVSAPFAASGLKPRDC